MIKSIKGREMFVLKAPSKDNNTDIGVKSITVIKAKMIKISKFKCRRSS